LSFIAPLVIGVEKLASPVGEAEAYGSQNIIRG
jgi:hypothetical protein